MNLSRRHFLRHSSSLAALGGAAPLALNLSLMSRAAAQTGEYKALVCVFLRGGNDAFNTVLANDNESWTHYQAVRGQGGSSIALLAEGHPKQPSKPAGSSERLGGVVPISPANAQGRSFALHPELVPLKPLFDQSKRLAIVSNVGPLVVPTTKAQYALPGYRLPPKLFSHNDQQSVWQSMAAEGSTRDGWAGRMGDLLASGNGQAMFTSINTGGRAIWGTGADVQALSVNEGGVLSFATDNNGTLYGSAELADSFKRVASRARTGSPFEADHAAVVKRSLDSSALLATMLPAKNDSRWGGGGAAGSAQSLQYISPMNARATLNPLSTQLQTVARVIAAANGGGMAVRRQVFLVGLDGFDTHDGQTADHAELMARLAQGLTYFDAVLGSLGLRDNVTLFTASDFGRTFTSNGDGTDHGWGGHHFVLGGAVRGGDIYGRFPRYGRKNARGNGFDSSDDLLFNGVLLPSLAVDQHAATMGKWLGLSPTQLTQTLPNLANFSVRDLGFMV